jgi:hypothetical protein
MQRSAVPAGFLLAFTAACAAPDQRTLDVRTVVLPHPEDTASAFEPFVAIDPASPDRIVVGAQYGPGYNRAGRRIWTWSSDDGGRSWSGARVIPKPFPPAGQALAADLTMGFGPDGTLYHLSLTADSAPEGLMTAAVALAVSSDGGRTFTPRGVFGTVESPEPGIMVFTDKSWLAVDAAPSSPHSGTLYLGWSRNRVDFRDTSVTASPVSGSSRDSGRSLEGPVPLSPSGFGVTLATDSAGVLDAAWYELRPRTSEGYRILSATSRDGGRTFTAPAVITELNDMTQTIELPQIAVGPRGERMVCWSQGPVATAAGLGVWCSARTPGQEWSKPAAVRADSTASRVYAFPAIAASADAWWLLSYRADSSITVELSRSVGGTRFEHVADLSSPGARAPLCARPGLPCRRSGTGFFPGDYVSIAGSARRVVAAYVVPRDGGQPGSSTVMVSVVSLNDSP